MTNRNDEASSAATGEASGDKRAVLKNVADDVRQDKPPLLEPVLAGVPATLRSHSNRWAPWEAVWHAKRGKWDKQPRHADSLDSFKWSKRAWWSFDTAAKAYAESFGCLAGVGYVMTVDESFGLAAHGLIGVDLDRCIDETGELHHWAREIVDSAATYTEKSPGGKGLRLFGFGAIAQDWTNNEQGIEVYAGHGARFLTVTGVRLEGSADDLRHFPEGFLAGLEERYRKARTKPAAVTPMPMPLFLPESELPDPDELELPGLVREFLAGDMKPGPDRSGVLQAATAALYQATARGGVWRDDLVLSMLHLNATAWGVALDHRGQNEDKALAYLWSQCVDARAKLGHPVIDDFEDVSEPDPAGDIGFVDFSSLANGSPPPRRWVVHQWLPRQAVTALFGRGGHGKSLVAQQMAAAVAAGRRWLGLDTAAGPVLGLFCEDDADELLRRGADLFDALALDPTTDARALHLDARAGKANVLVSFDRNHLARPAPLMKRLRQQCKQLAPVLVILDNAAQLFAGEENARAEVTQFCNQLTAVAREFDCAVLLLGHTAKADSSEYSGSTGWDAAVRSRLLLERRDDGTTRLRKLKANYSGLDELILEYRNGAFVAVPPAQGATPETLEAIKPLIRSAVERFTQRQQATSHVTTARNYLVQLMKAEGLLGGLSDTLVRLTMGAMLDTGELVPNQPMAWKSASRHAVQGLACA